MNEVLTKKEQRQVLAENFPALFSSGRPWAIGTRQALFAMNIEGVSRATINKMGWFHTSRKGYIQAVADGVERITIDGMDAGKPTAEQIAYAKGQIAGFNAAKRFYKGKQS